MFTIVLDEQPDNLDVMMSLATVYEEQGKEEEALELVDFGKIPSLTSIYNGANVLTSYKLKSDEKESRVAQT